MTETIYFNGKKYEHVNQMPADVRQMYEFVNRLMVDENQDGVPDVMQPTGLSGAKETYKMIKSMAQLSKAKGVNPQQPLSIIRVTDTEINVDGKSYHSPEEMPNDVWERYDAAVNPAQDANWQEARREPLFQPGKEEVFSQPLPISQNGTPVSTVNSNARFILLVVAAILLIGCAAAAWLIVF
jgi:hypothetical protein